jgi:SAM-dependent methyltransferase
LSSAPASPGRRAPQRSAAISDADRAAVVAPYLTRFAKYGVDGRTLNPGKGNKHQIQHEVHASVGDLPGKTVLDLGCGLATFYEYLKAQGTHLRRYVGYDIVEPFIESNRARYPEAHFELRDLSRDPIAHRADYAIMCQVFNNRYASGNNEEVVKHVIAKAFDAVSTGVSIDLRTSYVNYEEPDLYYYSPEDMFSFAKSLTPFVKLRHDYLPYDFTLMLHKQGTMPWR